MFLTNSIINLLVTEKSRFAEQFLSTSALKQKARAHSWHATDEVDMKISRTFTVDVCCHKTTS